MSRFLDNLLVFGRVLRRAGIDVHPGRMLDVIAAFDLVNLASRDEVYHACRALLVHRHDQLAIFDRIFAAFWQPQPAGDTGHPTEADGSSIPVVDAVDIIAPAGFEPAFDTGEADGAAAEAALQTWSDIARLAHKDFAAFTAVELATARAILSRLAWNPGQRRTRRWVRGRGPQIDLRRAIADSLRTGGDVVKLGRRRRRVRPRPLVLLCDVSGSMERYSRMLLHFAHAIAWRHRRVEAFLFSTGLTRITRQLRLPRPNDALAAVSQSVFDWSGGTRIGSAVKELHQRWSRRVLTGGPVVLLVSDGWDRGDPQELAGQIARLQRSSHRVIWLNPLIGTADYAPLTRGLQAALPFVDDFLPARTLSNLMDLASHLNALA
jgi:uncharacterized protein with von Willebrand factor type A (vWA) domain